MKKTVKVLFSLVLVCLFAVQFAGAMPASASADRVASKWDDVQLDTSVYVCGDNDSVEKQDGDFGVKAGFSGADASGKSTLGEFLNGDYTITPPEGYYVSARMSAPLPRKTLNPPTSSDTPPRARIPQSSPSPAALSPTVATS